MRTLVVSIKNNQDIDFQNYIDEIGQMEGVLDVEEIYGKVECIGCKHQSTPENYVCNKFDDLDYKAHLLYCKGDYKNE